MSSVLSQRQCRQCRAHVRVQYEAFSKRTRVRVLHHRAGKLAGDCMCVGRSSAACSSVELASTSARLISITPCSYPTCFLGRSRPRDHTFNPISLFDKSHFQSQHGLKATSNPWQATPTTATTSAIIHVLDLCYTSRCAAVLRLNRRHTLSTMDRRERSSSIVRRLAHALRRQHGP